MAIFTTSFCSLFVKHATNINCGVYLIKGMLMTLFLIKSSSSLMNIPYTTQNIIDQRGGQVN